MKTNENPQNEHEVTSLMKDEGSSLEEGTARAEPSTFLQQEKKQIYNSRDFAQRGFSHKQRAGIAAALVMLILVLKMLFVDPFRTDKEKWERTKTLVDEAVEKSVAMDLAESRSANSTKSLFELEKAAEEFVRQEEGDDLG
jgi:hypothetical protein